MSPSAVAEPLNSQYVEIDADMFLGAMTFSANNKYLLSNGCGNLRVWRVRDGKQMATMKASGVECLAMSNDGKWIVAGGHKVWIVWKVETLEKVFTYWNEQVSVTETVEFSPNSTRLLVQRRSEFPVVLDVATRKRAYTLSRGWRDWLTKDPATPCKAKYSPQGDRIATCFTEYSGICAIEVWDSEDGRLLKKINVEKILYPMKRQDFMWSGNSLLAVLEDHDLTATPTTVATTIKQFDASTKSKLSEWSLPKTTRDSHYIATPKHGGFVAHATKDDTVTFWDTSSHTQIAVIQHYRGIRLIACSPDGKFLALACYRKVSIRRLFTISDLSPHLKAWTEAILASHSWKDALQSATHFMGARAQIYELLCERLEETDHVAEAVECYHQMKSELGEPKNLHGEDLRWTLDFRWRCLAKILQLGDTAADAQRHNEAISHYTTALSLDLPSPHVVLKRGKAFMATGSWKEALDDANQVIKLDPSSPWGYEMKHAVLHNLRDYDKGIGAFEAMLSKILQSPDSDVQKLGDKYISPSSTRATITKIVQQTIRHLPRVLINTATGRLCNKAEQAFVFESSPIFRELVSSMTRRIDYVRIKREVRQYFKYVMLSHKWDDNEPLFHQVVHLAVYDLEKSLTHDKLKTFCKIVRDAGFVWAWSDTCCIDKTDHFVLQEALVAMFKWYKGSAMVIVFLRGVHSSAQRGALAGSIWNTRGWTLQEYIAAEVVRFYTEDWTPYLDLKSPNHKVSPEIMSEMEQATGVPARQLMALRPGLSGVREKLRLASTRQTTRIEDTAYSLLGIFSVVGMPAIYGEGDASLGRLLANVLTRSGDVSILAWTGDSGPFNSCLPALITVFNEPTTSHLPLVISDAEMEKVVAVSQTSSFDLDAALRLYDRLDELATPRFAESRMTLPCIAFQLPPLSQQRTRPGYAYRVDTPTFGTVEIRTRHDLSRMKLLYLVHPWLDSLLGHEDLHSEAFVVDVDGPPSSPSMDDEGISEEEIGGREVDEDYLPLREPESPSHPTLQMAPIDRETRARRLVARLRQSFGAILLTLTAAGRRVVGYKRVAADSAINVRFQENVSLTDILDNVRTLDVL